MWPAAATVGREPRSTATLRLNAPLGPARFAPPGLREGPLGECPNQLRMALWPDDGARLRGTGPHQGNPGRGTGGQSCQFALALVDTQGALPTAHALGGKEAISDTATPNVDAVLAAEFGEHLLPRKVDSWELVFKVADRRGGSSWPSVCPFVVDALGGNPRGGGPASSPRRISSEWRQQVDRQGTAPQATGQVTTGAASSLA